jgi:hypothetical protein
MPKSLTRNTTYTSSDFERLLNDALVTYTKETEHDLLTDPIASKILSRDSPEAILSVLREFLALDTSKNDDFKLSKWLQLVVHGLYALSAGPTRSVGSHTVSHGKFVIFLSV